MTPQELKNKAMNADHDKLESYIRMYDRILLYTLASNIMAKENIEESIDLWEKVIKKTIDSDSVNRTKFMESTSAGRIAKLRREPDGEAMRLSDVKTWKIARDIISANLSRDEEEEAS